MTLDEAITHHTWAAQNSEGEVAEEHEQYAMWLCDLKRLRNTWDTVHANTRAVVLENEQLKSENASLRGAAMGLGELCDQLKAENKKLRSLVRGLAEDMKICCGECWLGCGNVVECDNEECDHKKDYRRICALGIEVEE